MCVCVCVCVCVRACACVNVVKFLLRDSKQNYCFLSAVNQPDVIKMFKIVDCVETDITLGNEISLERVMSDYSP